MKPSLILYAWNAAAWQADMKNEVKFAKFQFADNMQMGAREIEFILTGNGHGVTARF